VASPDDNSISSPSNPKVKNLAALSEKQKERREQGLFVVEGDRELRHCIEAGFTVESLFICPEIAGGVPEGLPVPERSIFRVTPEVYSKVAYREGTEGIIAEVRERKLSLGGLQFHRKNPLVIVLEGVEKPGNIGAVLRTADGTGADAVILCGCPTDIFNPNVIRASLGSIFTVPTVCCESAEAIRWLKDNEISIYTAQLQDSRPYYDSDMKRACAIVLGSEDKGLTQAWRDASDAHVLIPMLGRMDSLNVSISASILCYEAVRQRFAK
jgi:TrmH family RNA methyltransferase